MSALCGNRKVHGSDRVYHADREAVRACFFPPPEPALCEHQMSAALCAGPQHYPTDEQMGGDHVATESEAHAEWHRNAGVPIGPRGGSCPWDSCGWALDYEADLAEAAEAQAEERREVQTALGMMLASGEAERAAYEAGKHIPACRYAGLPLTEARTAEDCCCNPPPTPIYDGVYTVETPSGHRTFRV